MSGYRRCLIMLAPLAILFSILPFNATASEVVRIPLTLDLDSSGFYYVAAPDSVAFDAGRGFPDITDVRLHLTGTACCHEVVGGTAHGPVTGSVCSDPGLEFGFLVDGDEVYPTVHTIPGFFDNSGSFATCQEQPLDVEIPFASDPGNPSWSFLADGKGTVRLMGFEGPFCAYPTFCFNQHSLVLTTAELLIEVPVTTPVEERSWGTIKAIYR